jgi:peroxiredoxin
MINKHKIFELPLYLAMSGIYIVLKFVISPFLYLAKVSGLRSSFPTQMDATINKSVLPLTEKPDKVERLDVESKLKPGDQLPSVSMKFPDGKMRSLKDYSKGSLLIIFVRGSWCSYSRLHLADVMLNKQNFENAGIKILAITGYQDQDWWSSNGIEIPMCVDLNGELFETFGVKINNWIEYAWGRNLPHESAFLFDKNGLLVFRDVRKVSSIFPGQRFLGSATLLKNIDKLEHR